MKTVLGYVIALLIFGSACFGYATTTNPDHLWAQQCKEWDDWDKPAPPFKIFGNSFYVGSCGISAILITSDQGHVLIDGGTAEGAKVIEANIQTLGFSLSDITLLLHSHEHFDHVGGLAYLQQKSQAEVKASPIAAEVLASGVVNSKDPQAGMHDQFAAVPVSGIVQNRVEVSAGDVSLLPIFTPGHSPGALSWQWQSCEQAKCLSIVYADSLSPVSKEGYNFSAHPIYLAAYRRGLKALAGIECDILLAPHPSAAQMRQRLLSAQGLVDQSACGDYAVNVSHRLDKRLQKEQYTP